MSKREIGYAVGFLGSGRVWKKVAFRWMTTNSVNLAADLREYVEGVRQVIQILTDAQQKQDALEIVDAVEESIT